MSLLNGCWATITETDIDTDDLPALLYVYRGVKGLIVYTASNDQYDYVWMLMPNKRIIIVRMDWICIDAQSFDSLYSNYKIQPVPIKEIDRFSLIDIKDVTK